jgi:hypothetical protein
MAGAITPNLQSLAAGVAAVLVALLVMSSPAEAQAWREYRYSGFAISFPIEPTIESGTYATAEGTTVDARIYSAQQDGTLYKVTVADLSRVRRREADFVSTAIGLLTENGDIVVDLPHRVNGILGRQLSIAGHDGSRTAVAVFYRNRRLYLVEGTILPTHDDPMSSNGMRFQQSLRFIIPNARGNYLCELRSVPLNLVDRTR